MGLLTKGIHLTFDAVLVSAVLAGVKRSTGLTPTSLKASSVPAHVKSISPDTDTEKTVQVWLDRYLGVGEWVMDTSIAFMSTSSYFERRR